MSQRYNTLIYLDLANVFRHRDEEYVAEMFEHGVPRRGYIFQQE